ncbi:MAG TPA: MFS transporter [Terriglobia bacterium]|nr:MFS transporter [Terriglobia bacterium]
MGKNPTSSNGGPLNSENRVGSSPRVFYGWWITLAAFLNLFFTVGIVYYGFPVFYPSLVESLGFTRAQLTLGFLYGFVIVGLALGFLAGVMIDRLGPRRVILLGIGFVGLSLVLMGRMTHLWQYYVLCITEVIGYVLTGPIPNQVLISNWFRAKRGRAMGYAYLGLGLGGAVSPLAIGWLIGNFGWRRAFEAVGAVILLVLFPAGIWITRSTPQEMGLNPDGESAAETGSAAAEAPSANVRAAVRSSNFWLILAGTTLTIGAIGAVMQHIILFLKDQQFSTAQATRLASGLLVSSLAGRVVVGYFADRYNKKNVMAVFYLVLGLSIPMLFLAPNRVALWGFAVVFGFAMGADYMLIPLVTAECFGLAALGKLLALIIMGYSLGQWFAPWLAGRIFDTYRSYDFAWMIMATAGVVGALAIYAISVRKTPKVL